MESPLIELEAVSKIYGSDDTEVRAMDRVDLQIGRGEMTAIMGASGSGKSTCMNVIGCLDTPTAGQYRFCGVDVAGLDRDQQALLRRQYLGFVFQSFNLLPRTTALANVELPLVYRGYRRARRRALALEALARVGLADRAGHTPNQLSGGQQQRVAIARAIVSNPALLLADEPTGNLDTSRSLEIMALLRDLNTTGGITIVMITHEPELIREAVRRVVWFRDGRIVADGPPVEVLQ